MSDTILGNKKISELDPIGKISGTEQMLIDNGDETLKTTVDALLGYIAKEINSGTFSPDIFNSCNIVEIPIGENIPIASRKDGNFYLRNCDAHEAQIAAGIPTNIRVSPNMGLKIITD